ncbi:hypothetical protein ACE6H2_007490 [Prunus campanulata]
MKREVAVSSECCVCGGNMNQNLDADGLKGERRGSAGFDIENGTGLSGQITITSCGMENGQFVAAAVVHVPQALVAGDAEACAAREAVSL